MTSTNEVASWVADTEQALELARNASEAQRQFSELQDADSQLSGLVAGLSELTAAAAVVRPLGWIGRYPTPEVKKYLAEAAKSLGSRPLNQTVRLLARFEAEVRADLIEFWRRQAAERMGDLAELRELATVLGDVSGVGELSKQLEIVLGQLARNQTQLPTEQSSDLLEYAESILDQIEQGLQPDSVRRFLSAATRGGAALDLMTDDVIEWLRSHNASRNFKVVAGAPGGSADD
ncbi:hypothetical protein [Mycolicibacterium fortuitum]|uniref:hypothetical protein n=1 Tax=Mycolicibacterium fortuitum TaxID=1766 RepID=UPI001CDBE0FB|nr:hypothetical protein [Mycolicibacterium fortuitum]UBV16877.1 hypothetical protein H8Z57_08755 [Mycolicibacterium fortuitum]